MYAAKDDSGNAVAFLNKSRPEHSVTCCAPAAAAVMCCCCVACTSCVCCVILPICCVTGVAAVSLAELEAEIAGEVEVEPSWDLPPHLQEYG